MGDDNPPANDVPTADAAEQQQPVAASVEDADLDLKHVADLIQLDADAADVIEQASIVPLPDDDSV